MADRLEFKEKLSGILSAAREQGGKIALEDVELYFEEDRLSQEQIDLVCEYLLAQKIAVTGYVPKSGTVKERKEEPASLSNEEQSYIEEYLKDIDQMQGKSLAEARMAYYLPKEMCIRDSATIARLNRKEGRYRMTIIPADFVTLEEEKMAETTKEWPHVFAKLPFDHQIFLDKFDANHCHAVYGDKVEELKMISEMLDIDVEILGEEE